MGAIPQEVLNITTEYINKLNLQIPVEQTGLVDEILKIGTEIDVANK